MAYDLSKFKKRIRINASVPTIYEAWATRRGLERWFLRQAKFVLPDKQIRPADKPAEAGDRYEWLWYGYPDDTIEQRQILKANGKDYLQFEFSGESIVSVSIHPDGNETIVDLLQEIPQGHDAELQYRIGCDTGWTFYLANLKSIFEGGIDLRNKNVELTDVLNS